MGINTAMASTGKKMKSAAAVIQGGKTVKKGVIRPASQSRVSPASEPPAGVCMPVQFLAAVNKKPAMTAGVYPNSISWACQLTAV